MLHETLALVIIGITLGTLTALLASRYVRSQLFGVTPGDPLALSSAVVLLFVVAALAWVRARTARNTRRSGRRAPVRLIDRLHWEGIIDEEHHLHGDESLRIPQC